MNQGDIRIFDLSKNVETPEKDIDYSRMLVAIYSWLPGTLHTYVHAKKQIHCSYEKANTSIYISLSLLLSSPWLSFPLLPHTRTYRYK